MTTLTAPNLIALGGWLRSGKDAFADWLVEHHGWVKVGLADPILEHMLIVNPWIKVRLREAFRLRIRPGFHTAKRLYDRLGYVDAKSIDDFRAFMWRDGTDAGRNFIGRDVWVSVMARRVSERLAAGEKLVITSVRYPNELDMVRDQGALTLWVDRAGTTPGDHESDQSLTAADFDGLIDNDGTLDDLHDLAEQYAAGTLVAA